jgi:hypothetical protein
MAKPKGESKTGLIVALVFFILTTIGLGVGTYTGYTADEGKDQTIKDEKKKLDAMSKERDWWKFQAQILREALGHLPGADLADVGVKREQMATSYSGQPGFAEIDKLLKDIIDKKIAWDPGQKKYRDSYEGLLVAAQKRYDDLATQLKGAQKQLDDATRKARDAEAARDAAKDAYDQALLALGNKQKEDQNDQTMRLENLTKEITRMGKVNTDMQIAHAAEQKRLNDELAKKDAEIKQYKTLVAQRNDELLTYRKKEQEAPKAMTTEYKIVEIVGQIPYINLGHADKVKPQLTFAIHGVGPDGKPLQTPKGTLEVVNVVDTHLSQARITSVKDPNRDPVLINDVLFNPSWDPTLKKHVALTGIVDLTGDGRDSTAEFRRNLERQNIVVDAWLDPKDFTVQGKVTVQTDYLILGDGAESLGSSRDRKTIGDKLDKGIGEMKAQAEKNGVQVISLRKYLEMIGYRLPRATGDLPTGNTGPYKP